MQGGEAEQEGAIGSRRMGAEDVQTDPKLQSLLVTQTAVVLDIEYASLETSYESVIFGARLPIVECF